MTTASPVALVELLQPVVPARRLNSVIQLQYVLRRGARLLVHLYM